MPRDGSGNYTRPVNSVDPAVSNTNISSVDFNSLTLDLATEMTDSLDRSGKGAMLAALAMGGNKITNLGTPAAASDAARLDNITSLVLAGDVTGSIGTNAVANVPGGVVAGLAAGSYPAAGKVGEVKFASNTVPLSSSVTANVTSLPLTAGNWLMFAQGTIAPAALLQNLNMLISTVNASLTGVVVNAYYGLNFTANSTLGSGQQMNFFIGMATVNIGAPTNYYVNTNCAFTSTCNAAAAFTAIRLA